MTEIPDAAVAAVMKLDIHEGCQVDLCQDCIRKVLEAAYPAMAQLAVREYRAEMRRRADAEFRDGGLSYEGRIEAAP